MLGRFFRFVALTFFATVAASTIGALIMKDRIVSRGKPEDDEVALATIMDELHFKSTAKAFRGGTALLWMGGGDIDLREATLDPAGATLDVRTIMGGGRILVPATWRVTTNLVAFMGGIGDTRKVEEVALPADAPHLELKGWLFMGGFAIATEGEAATPDQISEIVVKATGKKNGKSVEIETEAEAPSA